VPQKVRGRDLCHTGLSFTPLLTTFVDALVYNPVALVNFPRGGAPAFFPPIFLRTPEGSNDSVCFFPLAFCRSVSLSSIRCRPFPSPSREAPCPSKGSQPRSLFSSLSINTDINCDVRPPFQANSGQPSPWVGLKFASALYEIPPINPFPPLLLSAFSR